ncbi:uncharacterized protein LOC135371210 isoform X3 [Ornithodoros turicata]|uniref:uncharacterized protein LOC135371210 isoform X3 n=1 Tax=Ornithodoros turicata TaxID=34597 RepID=UPI003139DDEA
MKVVEVRSQHAHADNRPLHDATTGLHRLAHAEELKIIMIEDYRNWKLLVRDSRNMDLFYVWRAKLRRTDTCGFIFGPASECFTAYMTQMDNVVVMCFERPLRLQSGLKGFFCCCLGQVQTMAGSVIGEIRIEESISVYFPVNLDVYIKGCLIGCATLVVSDTFFAIIRIGVWILITGTVHPKSEPHHVDLLFRVSIYMSFACSGMMYTDP